MVPDVALPPFAPFTSQFTAVLDVPVTCAVNCTVCVDLAVLTVIVVEAGVTVTVMEVEEPPPPQAARERAQLIKRAGTSQRPRMDTPLRLERGWALSIHHY